MVLGLAGVIQKFLLYSIEGYQTVDFLLAGYAGDPAELLGLLAEDRGFEHFWQVDGPSLLFEP